MINEGSTPHKLTASEHLDVVVARKWLGSQLDEKLVWGMIGFEDCRDHDALAGLTEGVWRFLTSLILLAADSPCSSVVPQIYELGFATF